MNFVRRSLGAAALTFCGMLSLHADTAAVVQPVTDINVNAAQIGQNVTDFKAALKQVLANTLKTSLIDQEGGFHRSSVRQAIADKKAELIAASTNASDDNQAIVAAGLKTVEIVEVESAADAFEAKLVLLKKLAKDVDHGSVVDYINAVKANVADKDMITILKIAKKCVGLDDAAKAELLKQRDELKVDKSLVDILILELDRLDIAEEDYKDYIASFTKKVVNAIPKMTADQAGKAHKYALAQARIVARAARAANLVDVDVDAFDAQIVAAKAALKARFVAANKEVVDLQAEALVKKTEASFSWFKPWSWFGGKKGGAVAPAVNLFAGVTENLNDLNAAQVNKKIKILKTLRTQANAVYNLVQNQAYVVDAQREYLIAVVQTIIAKFRECLENTQVAINFMDTQADASNVRAEVGGIRLVLISEDNVRAALGDQANHLLNDFAVTLNEIYAAADARANQA